jgi:hypothetical protein
VGRQPQQPQSEKDLKQPEKSFSGCSFFVQILKKKDRVKISRVVNLLSKCCQNPK